MAAPVEPDSQPVMPRTPHCLRQGRTPADSCPPQGSASSPQCPLPLSPGPRPQVQLAAQVSSRARVLRNRTLLRTCRGNAIDKPAHAVVGSGTVMLQALNTAPPPDAATPLPPALKDRLRRHLRPASLPPHHSGGGWEYPVRGGWARRCAWARRVLSSLTKGGVLTRATWLDLQVLRAGNRPASEKHILCDSSRLRSPRQTGVESNGWA